MLELSKDQRDELAQRAGEPVRVVDPATQKEYVIVPIDLFDRVRALLGDEQFDIRETYAAQETALAKVWDDPALDVYNDYDAHRRQ
jgi:hypothetical protein